MAIPLDNSPKVVVKKPVLDEAIWDDLEVLELFDNGSDNGSGEDDSDYYDTEIDTESDDEDTDDDESVDSYSYAYRIFWYSNPYF